MIKLGVRIIQFTQVSIILINYNLENYATKKLDSVKWFIKC